VPRELSQLFWHLRKSTGTKSGLHCVPILHSGFAPSRNMFFVDFGNNVEDRLGNCKFFDFLSHVWRFGNASGSFPRFWDSSLGASGAIAEGGALYSPLPTCWNSHLHLGLYFLQCDSPRSTSQFGFLQQAFYGLAYRNSSNIGMEVGRIAYTRHRWLRFQRFLVRCWVCLSQNHSQGICKDLPLLQALAD